MNRVTNRLKRRRTSNGHDGPSRVRPEQNAILSGKDEVQEDDGRTEAGVSPPVAPGRPPERRSHSSTLSPDLQPNPSATFHLPVSHWISGHDSSLDGATTWSLNAHSLNQIDCTATQSTEQENDDWFFLPLDIPSTFPTASGQDQGRSSGVGNSMATNSSFQG
jgi:hypothetical protein